jgi:phage tail sheath gpL-like
MLGQYTFGLKAIPYSDVTNSAIYYGNAAGGKATAADAGAIDLKAEKQMFALKARFNIHVLESFAPVDNGGTKGVVTITPTVTTAGDGKVTITVEGDSYDVDITSSDSTATKVGDTIRAALNADTDFKNSNYTVGGTSTIVFTQKKADGYTYAAGDWGATYTATGSGNVSFAKANTTSSAAPTGYGVTFTIQHCTTATGTFTDLVSSKIACDALCAQNTPVYEITVPSNCHRFVRLKVQGEASATAGTMLVAIEPKN